MLDLVLHHRTSDRALGRAMAARTCAAVLPHLKLGKVRSVELGIVVVGSTAMRTLNRTRRRNDEATDVLSFPLAMRPMNGYTSLLLGDLFICPEVVRHKAAAAGRSVRAQMQWTLVHGMLHLGGYDHERSASAARRMFALEQKILASL